MNDQELAERLARLATEMESMIEPMHTRGNLMDSHGLIQQSFICHRYAADLKEMARHARYRAIEISKEADG